MYHTERLVDWRQNGRDEHTCTITPGYVIGHPVGRFVLDQSKIHAQVLRRRDEIDTFLGQLPSSRVHDMYRRYFLVVQNGAKRFFTLPKKVGAL